MDLLGRLRHAEQQGKRTVHQAAEKFQKMEAAILHKAKGHASTRVSAYPDPEQPSTTQVKARTGIVSVNGKDVGEMRCTGGHRSR